MNDLQNFKCHSGNYRFSHQGSRTMPRLLGKLPAYRKHKATGQAVVTLGGRDFYLGTWNTAASKAEYKRVTREWLASGGAMLAPDRQGALTIVELLAAFKRHAKSYYVDPDGNPTSELATYETLIRRFNALYGRTPAVQFGPLSSSANGPGRRCGPKR